MDAQGSLAQPAQTAEELAPGGGAVDCNEGQVVFFREAAPLRGGAALKMLLKRLAIIAKEGGQCGMKMRFNGRQGDPTVLRLVYAVLGRSTRYGLSGGCGAGQKRICGLGGRLRQANSA